MSVRFYDEALLNKIRGWTTDTATQVYTTEDVKELFKVIEDQTNDASIKLPIIAVRRVGGYSIKNTTKKHLMYDGKMLSWDKETATMLNAIPISIKYQIDIYARKQSECDEIVRNLVFNLITFPVLHIELPYFGKNYVHDSHIELLSEVDDNSDIAERLSFGQFTRFSLGAIVDDAYLFDVRKRTNYTVDINLITDDEITKKENN